jgi:membrane protein involved in colicin uptake
MGLFKSAEERTALAEGIARQEAQQKARLDAQEKARREAEEKARLEAEAKAAQEWADKRAEMSLHPFNPRTDVSADAIHIAKHTSGRIVGHLWCIFVLLPVVLGILFAMLK